MNLAVKNFIDSSFEVKANGKFTGYLVKFSDSENTDLENDYFTPNTWFGFIKTKKDVPLFLDHTFDKNVGKAQIGLVDLEIDPIGVKMEGALNWLSSEVWQVDKIEQQKEYLTAIQSIMKSGLMGASSGAIGYAVERKQTDNNANEFVKWYIAEASLTLTPAEPNLIGSIKKLNQNTQDFYFNNIKANQVLNKKNKKDLNSAKELIDNVLLSAEKEEEKESKNISFSNTIFNY